MLQDEFRQALRRVPTPVAVVAASDANGSAALAVGSFDSISLTPPLVGFYVAASSTSWPRIAEIGRFCASVLGAHQEEICRRFAQSGGDKFATVAWHRSPSGMPCLDDLHAWFDCDIAEVHPVGDHFLCVGLVTEFGVRDAGEECGVGRPLVFYGGAYRSVTMSSTTPRTRSEPGRGRRV